MALQEHMPRQQGPREGEAPLFSASISQGLESSQVLSLEWEEQRTQGKPGGQSGGQGRLAGPRGGLSWLQAPPPGQAAYPRSAFLL